jgi:predicted porin
MNKKLLAVAVAGAFTAAPLAAFAQSTVTISGFFSVSMENISLGSYGTGGSRPLGGNKSEGRLGDNSSRVVFNVVEDLGGGMRAVAQADLRFNVANTSSGLPPMSGNTHVGLRGSWGQIRAGLQDLHYGLTESYMNDRGDLRNASFAILGFLAAGGAAIANHSRTPNTVFYDTPDFGGFTARIAYSFSPMTNSTLSATGLTSGAGVVTGGPAQPTQSSNDIGSTSRKGNAWNFAPYYSAGGINAGYSYWRAKLDNPNGFASAVASADQRGDRLAGSYLFPMGLKIGLAYDRSRLNGAQTLNNGTALSRRTAWSFPVSYAWGASEIHFHYDRAGADKVIAGDTKARMIAVSYVYNLSKRTNVALGYAQIRNGAQAAYNLFTSTSLGSADAGLKPGEDPRLLSLTMRHAF